LWDKSQERLQALERLRENRVKQLASRLAAAALGLGKDLSAQSDPRFASCHAIVIENLTNYRPEDKRTRRENRQLMNWSSAKVKKYLAEACQLHGLHLREVTAAYTSRQDARTGAPGIRCEDVPVCDFLKAGGLWHREIQRARAHLDQGTAPVSAYDRLILDLAARWDKTPESEWKKARPLRLPRRGGEVFVSTRMAPYVDNNGRIRFPFTQADLNAAANIGLRALLDPDWEGRWWYVPCLPAPSCIPLEDRTRGSAAVESGHPLPTAGQDGQKSTSPSKARAGRRRRTEGQERRAVNLWRDPAGDSLLSSPWLGTKEYWDNVTITVISQILRSCCGLNAAPPLDSADDSPF
jgi:IS605 OrfB family transposase